MSILQIVSSDSTENYAAPAFVPPGTRPQEMPTVTLSSQQSPLLVAPLTRTWNEVMERVLEEDADLWEELANL